METKKDTGKNKILKRIDFFLIVICAFVAGCCVEHIVSESYDAGRGIVLGILVLLFAVRVTSE